MRRRLYTFALLFVISLALFGCTSLVLPAPAAPAAGGGTGTGPTTINVFAAASLIDAFTEIGEDFAAAHPGVAVVFNFAGSNELATQIREGAPADVFASANTAQMNVAIETGRIISGTQRTFVHNRLVVITPGDNPAGLRTLQDLATSGGKIIFAATEVPAGRYSLEFLDKAAVDGEFGIDYKTSVMANVVSYEANVRAVLIKVTLGEADAGIVYTSDVGAVAEEVAQIEIPDHLNTIASYPIAPLGDSTNTGLAQQFVDYVLSPAGQQVLVAHGFISTTGDTSDAGGS